MTQTRLQEILTQFKDVSVAVYGDFCLDAYWILHADGSEVSVETGVRAEAVERHYYSPGGASNVVANISALGPRDIRAIGSIGDDIFGDELTRLLNNLGTDTSYLIKQGGDFSTLAFCKQYLGREEKLRVDFGTLNERSAATGNVLLAGIKKALEECDVLIYNQQVPGTLGGDTFIEESNKLICEHDGTPVLLDSRHYGDRFSSVIRKLNEVEAAALCGEQVQPRDEIPRGSVLNSGRKLSAQSGKAVFITRGPAGIAAFDTSGDSEIPGIRLDCHLDTVGAGDTVVSALGLCLGAGVAAAEAAELANIAASVTVQKQFMTGTASAKELLALNDDVVYIHQPELASNQKGARYLDETRIEICGALREGRIRYALFDHDGTISTLRQGWEEVMEPMMIGAILGTDRPSRRIEDTVRREVLEYIDISTGIQTILQMEHLVEMVRRWQVVPPEKIRDAAEYKQEYSAALMISVEKRMTDVRNGERSRDEFIMPGILEFLTALKDRGITLFLASGTDRDDVIREANYLGYADLFEDRIYGSVGDVSKYSKKKLLMSLMSENALGDTDLAVFGDGPVEIRECRRQNGIAVGIASDEESPGRLNLEKRTRLIHAGAQIMLPDFSDWRRLLEILHPASS